MEIAGEPALRYRLACGKARAKRRRAHVRTMHRVGDDDARSHADLPTRCVLPATPRLAELGGAANPLGAAVPGKKAKAVFPTVPAKIHGRERGGEQMKPCSRSPLRSDSWPPMRHAMTNDTELAVLEKRLGRRYARQRLGIEKDHEAQVFGQGINFFHIENLTLSHALIRAMLMASGLYWRGLATRRRSR